MLVAYNKTVQPYSLDPQYMQKLEQVRKSAQSNSSNTRKRHTKDTILRAGTVVHRMQINTVSPKPTHYGIYRWFILASVSDWLCSIIIDSRLPIISVSDLVD